MGWNDDRLGYWRVPSNVMGRKSFFFYFDYFNSSWWNSRDLFRIQNQ